MASCVYSFLVCHPICGVGDYYTTGAEGASCTSQNLFNDMPSSFSNVITLGEINTLGITEEDCARTSSLVAQRELSKSNAAAIRPESCSDGGWYGRYPCSADAARTEHREHDHHTQRLSAMRRVNHRTNLIAVPREYPAHEVLKEAASYCSISTASQIIHASVKEGGIKSFLN